MTTPFAQATYDALEPVAREDAARGYPLLDLLTAISQMWDLPESAFRSVGGFPAGSQALDIDRAPTRLLRWLGQFVGVRVRTGLGDADSRAQIRDEQGFRRARTATLIAAIQATLDPASTRYVAVQNRYAGNASKINVSLRTAQVLDPVATLAAALGAKLAGLILTINATAAHTYAEVEATWAGNTYMNAQTAFATYAAAEAT